MPTGVSLATKGMICPLGGAVGISDVLRVEEDTPRWLVRVKKVVQETAKTEHSIHVKTVYEKVDG